MIGSSRRNKRKAAILLSLCLILGGVLFQQLSSGSIGSSDVRAAVISPVSDIALPAESPPAIPSLDILDETVLRPLFLPSRRSADPVKETPTAAAPKTKRDRLMLLGVIIFGDQRLALVKQDRVGAVVRVAEGQRVNSWQVDKILPDRVVLTENGESRELRLKDANGSTAERGEDSRRQPRKKKGQALSLSQEVVADDEEESENGSDNDD